MTTEDVVLEKKNNHLALILGAVALALAVASSLTSVQNLFKSLVNSNDRQILAKITGYYGLEQNEYLILKIKDSAGLQIEIYEKSKDSSQQTFKQKFELTQDTDAYITLDKNTTNLALSDVDKDGQLDILTPSVDRNGNLRLNSFRFNTELNSFEPIQESNTSF